MSLPSGRNPRAVTLQGRNPILQWSVLAALTLALVVVLEFARLPAAVLLGAMAAAIMVAGLDGRIAVPPRPYILAQSIVGCLIAHGITAEILGTMASNAPVMLSCIVAVIVVSTVLGGILAKLNVLPGTTAVWGSAPGAASAMVLMSEAHGADVRLVAFMQYLRVVFVAIAASLVARLWLPDGAPGAAAIDWFPPLDWAGLGATLAVAVIGAVIGIKLRIPAGALIVPMFAGILLADLGLIRIVLPPWLLAASYLVLGWAIGLRFSREVVRYAAKAFPRVALSIVILIAACGGLAVLLHVATGIDPLTAYLATSPGGADSVAIIAASVPVDVPFVLAMQTGRFLLVLLIGPWVARAVARCIAPRPQP